VPAWCDLGDSKNTLLISDNHTSEFPLHVLSGRWMVKEGSLKTNAFFPNANIAGRIFA
jgi:hypothetical protein